MPKQLSRRGFVTLLTGASAFSRYLPPVEAIDQGIRAPKAPGRFKIAIIGNPSAPLAEAMKHSAKDFELAVFDPKNSIKNFPTDADVIIGQVNAEQIKVSRNLKWVQTYSAGVEWMSDELRSHGSVLTNMQRVYAPVIAETAIGLLLSLTRGIAPVSVPAFAERKWTDVPESFPLIDLYGKTIGIVGMGGIGSETARRLHYGFKMRILATDPKPMSKPDFVEELLDPSSLMTMVSKVDVLMSAAPLTSETNKMFNRTVFSGLKEGAYFINVSRGGLVDQAALKEALDSGRLAGAGLDVVTPEPLPSNDPLWNCKRLVITPHNSGHAPVVESRQTVLISENVRRYSSGLPLLNVVDKVKGY